MKVEVDVYECESVDDLPITIPEFLAWVSSHLAKIPNEHIPAAKIEFRGRSDWGDGFDVSTRIYYTREETTEECITRAAREAENAQYLRERELEQLAKLKAKYPES